MEILVDQQSFEMVKGGKLDEGNALLGDDSG